MSNFFVKTSLLDNILLLGNLLAFLYIIWIYLEYVLALSHYVFITGCTPSTATCPAPTNNFRPAGNVPEYVALPESTQVDILFNGFWYFVLTSDMLRPLIAFFWLLIGSYIRQRVILWLHAIILLVAVAIELPKLIIFIIAYFNPTSRWFAWSPLGFSSIPSTEFVIILWSSIITSIYIVIQYAMNLFLIRSITDAKKTERMRGVAPISSRVYRSRTEIKSFLNVKVPQ